MQRRRARLPSERTSREQTECRETQHDQAATRIRRESAYDRWKEMRFSSLISGTNHAVSGSRGCTTTGKPNTDGSTPVISVKVLPSSEDTKMPLWCCTHMRWGAAGHC